MQCIMCIIQYIYKILLYIWYYNIYIYLDTDIEMECLLEHLVDKSNQHDMWMYPPVIKHG